MLLLLIWSSNCTGQALRALHEWALSEGAELVRRDLVRRLRLRTSPTEVALLLATFLSLERLYPCTSNPRRPSGASVLGGRSQDDTRQNLDAMNYSFRRVVRAEADPIEGQRIHLFLANVLDTREPILREPCDVWDLYWKSRLFPQRSHDEVLSLLSTCAGQIKPMFTAFFETHDKRNMLSIFEEDSDDSTTIAPSKGSQALRKEAHEEVGKRRGCCAFWGFILSCASLSS